MPVSTVIGLLAALIGSTATLLAAWVYIRSEHPPKGELFRTALIIIIIPGRARENPYALDMGMRARAFLTGRDGGGE